MCCVCVATAGLGPDSHPQFFSQKLHEAASKCASEEEEAKKISPIQAENDVL
jgi:hypothetical protein